MGVNGSVVKFISAFCKKNVDWETGITMALFVVIITCQKDNRRYRLREKNKSNSVIQPTSFKDSVDLEIWSA